MIRVAVIASALMISAPALAASHVPPVDDVLAVCGFSRSQELCEINTKSFRADWPKAYKRNYQAQRNVAFCLLTGCDGAVRVNKPLGCAWRVVILASGSTKVDDTDRTNYEWECLGKLSPGEAIAFQASATDIYRQVYGRTLPPFD